MTKKEVQNLLGWAIANHPGVQEKDMRPTAALWEKMLGDINYEVAEKALMKVMATNKFFPTVAEIRNAAMEITSPRMLSWDEAWGEVRRAIHNYGSYRPQEAYNSMSPDVAGVVRRIGWLEMCLSENPDVIRGQFRKAWEAHVKNRRELGVLPAEVQDFIGAIADRMDIENNRQLKLVSEGGKNGRS